MPKRIEPSFEEAYVACEKLGWKVACELSDSPPSVYL